MTSRGRRSAIAAVAGVAVAAAGTTGWFFSRTAPDAVRARFVDAVLARHPGATVDRPDVMVPRWMMPSGLYVEARLSPIVDACRAHRVGCGDAIDRGVDDVDRIVAAQADPKRSMIAAFAVADATPGYAYGFVTEPLAGPLEVRYALVDGVASTFVTSTIAARLGMSRAALHDAALARLAREPEPTLKAVDDPRVFRVIAGDDPVVTLLAGDRMARLADRLATRRLAVAVPSRGTLEIAVADAPGVAALARRIGPPPGALHKPGDVALMLYDVDAPDASRLTFAPGTRR